MEIRKKLDGGGSFIALLCIAIAMAVACTTAQVVAYAVDTADPGVISIASDGDDGDEGEGATAWDGTVDTTWYNSSKTSFTISKPEQLAGLAAITNGTAEGIDRDDFTGKTVTLDDDILLNATAATAAVTDGSQRNWVPIGDVTQTKPQAETGSMPSYDYTGSFNGTFDGAGHLIKNIYKHTSEDYGGFSGLFGTLGADAKILRVGLDGGYLYGRVVGGIAAVSKVTEDEATAGKMPLIDSCKNTATIEGNGSSTRGAGGIFGGWEAYIDNSDDDEGYRGMAYIANCYNTGTVGGSAGAPKGGIAGYGSVKIYGCLNLGDVDASNDISGAIAGPVLKKGYQDPAHPTGAGDIYCGEVRYSNSVTKADSEAAEMSTLYYVFEKAGDEDKGAEVAANATDDVYFLEDYPFSNLYYADYSVGSAFSLIRNDDWEYEFSLFWEDGDSVTELESLDERYGIAAEGLDGQFYTGEPIVPEVTLTYYNGRNSLIQGVDFLVAYANNVEVGTATATFTGIGKYSGTYGPVEWIINSTDISTGSIDAIPDQWFYGDAVEPAVTARTAGGTVLSSSDYTVTYENNDKVGTATVTVEGKDKLTGKLITTFGLYAASTSLKGSGTEADPYQLASKSDIQFLAHELNTGDSTGKYATAYYRVMNDINAGPDDENTLSADPIAFGSGSVAFSGAIDGNSKAITVNLLQENLENIRVGYSDCLAFIGKTSGDVTIKNLTLKGTVNSVIRDGGFIGSVGEGKVAISDCRNEATVGGNQYGAYAGGFVAQMSSSATLSFTDCVNAGLVEAREDVDSNGGGSAGGFVGLQSSNSVLNFERCSNTASVKGARQPAGGFLASAGEYSGSGTVTFVECANSGVIYTDTNGVAGGFVGYNQASGWEMSFSKCYNTGDIDAASPAAGAGGFIGQLYAAADIENCYNRGAVSGHLGNNSYSTRYGGFVGYRSSSKSLVMKNVYNTGVMDGSRPSGGLVGSAQSGTITLANAFYSSESSDTGYNATTTGWSAVTIEGEAQVQDPSVMKSDLFVTMLGTAFSKDTENVNDGFPILGDRESSDIADCAFSFTGNTVGSDGSLENPISYTGVLEVPVTINDGSKSKKLVEKTDYLCYCTPLSDGKAQVTYLGIGDYSGQKVYSFTFTKCDIAKCSVAPIPAMTLDDGVNGYWTPTVTVTSPAGTTLSQGSDYTVTYSNNTAAGTAMAVIAGMGEYYEGTTMKLFAITPGDITGGEVDGIDDEIAYSTSGPSIASNKVLVTTPNGTVLSNDFSDATPGWDYKFNYIYTDTDGKEIRTDTRSEVKAGNIKVIVVADCDNWIGEISKDVKYGVDLASDVTVKGINDVYEPSAKGIDISALDVTYQNYSSYYGWQTVSLLSDDSHSEYDISFYNADGDELEASQVTDAGTYTYKIIPSGYYGASSGWSGITWTPDRSRVFGAYEGTILVASSEFVITDDAITDGVEDHYLYTGEAITPAPVVTLDGDAPLIAGTDYTVSYLNADGEAIEEPTAAGTYTVVVDGLDPYVGTAKKTFEIDEPYMTVYVQKGNAEPEAVKYYDKDGFEGLKADSSDIVAALYSTRSATPSWQVCATDTYVTIDDLLSDAGVDGWTADSGVEFYVTPDDGTTKGFTYTYDAAHDLYWYPGTTTYATDTLGKQTIPAVLAITCASQSIAEGETAASTASALVERADGKDAPRLVTGVSADAYEGGDTNATAGARLTKSVISVTVAIPDKSDLNEAIAEAQKVMEDVTTSEDGTDVAAGAKWVEAEVKETLEGAIETAQAAATQAEINEAATALDEASTAFVEAIKLGTKAVDKTALSEAISASRTAEEGVVTSVDGSDVTVGEKWATAAAKDELEAAVADARAIATQTDVTQAEVDAAAQALEEAITAFNAAKKDGTKSADKATLNTAIATAQAAEEGVATSADGADVAVGEKWVATEAKEALDAAIKAAQGTVAKEDATQAEVDAAAQALGDALSAFNAAKKDGTKQPEVAPVDKAFLNTAIATAQAAEEGVVTSADGSDVAPGTTWVTTEAKQAFDTAVTAAKEASAKEDATQAEVDSAAQTLVSALGMFNDAKKNGTKEPEAAPVEKAFLNTVVATAQAAEEGVATSADGTDVAVGVKWVTTETKEAFDAAIATAQAAAAKEDATQEEVDEAAQALGDALSTFNAAKKDGTKQAESAPVDKISLITLVATAQAAEEGVATSADGADVAEGAKWVTTEAKEAFDSAISTAQAVVAKEDATQAEVNAAAQSLGSALSTFNAAKKDGTKAPSSDSTPADNSGNAGGDSDGNTNTTPNTTTNIPTNTTTNTATTVSTGANTTTVSTDTAKKANTMTVKANNVTVKYKKVKKAKKTLKASKAFSVSKAVGGVTYKKQSGSKNITVSKSGKVTIKKGLAKKTYKIKVKVTAAGNSSYNALSKTVTLIVTVK